MHVSGVCSVRWESGLTEVCGSISKRDSPCLSICVQYAKRYARSKRLPRALSITCSVTLARSVSLALARTYCLPISIFCLARSRDFCFSLPRALARSPGLSFFLTPPPFPLWIHTQTQKCILAGRHEHYQLVTGVYWNQTKPKLASICMYHIDKYLHTNVVVLYIWAYFFPGLISMRFRWFRRE